MKRLAALGLLAACAVVEAPAPVGMVRGTHGLIAVVDTTFPDWTDSTSADLTLGAWDAVRREIALDRRLTRPMRVLVLGHERCHAAIDDARLSLPPPVEEAVCDAIAAGFR